MDCPCGSGSAHPDCCGPFIDGQARPETAEALMRSRYAAYALENVDYVLSTHDPETRDDLDPAEVKDWAESSEWLSLEILDTKAGGPDDDEGEVEFRARWVDERERVQTHHERSVFKRRDGRWFFHDGDVMTAETVKRDEPKLGRNDPCHCGSGKKFKKCHGRPGAA